MSKVILPLLGSMLGIALLLPSTRGVTDTPSPTAQQLIERLGSDSFTERTQAAETLRARGVGVLPELCKAVDHPDAEIRRQLRSLMPILEAIAALEPKRVTLKAERQPLSAVLQQIETQTGYKIQVDSAAEEPCHLDLQDIPFWDALEQVGRATGRVVSLPELEKHIHLKQQKWRSPYVCMRGPFRVEALHFHEDRDIDFTTAGASQQIGRHDHRLTLRLSLLAEPRFVLLSMGTVEIEAALCEDGKQLRCVPGGAHSEWEQLQIALRPEFHHAAQVAFQRSSAKTKTVRLLRGTLPVLLVAERKRVVVTENAVAANGLTCRVGKINVSITRAELAADGTFYFRMIVPPKQEGNRWLWHQRVHLEDARGHRYQPNSRGASNSGGTYEIHLGFPKATDPAVGPPTRLIVEDWVTINHAIPFEFKDVPLP